MCPIRVEQAVETAGDLERLLHAGMTIARSYAGPPRFAVRMLPVEHVMRAIPDHRDVEVVEQLGVPRPNTTSTGSPLARPSENN